MKKYPAIFITEKIKSPNELISWIKECWEPIIKPAVYGLPERVKEKSDFVNFIQGIWLMKLHIDQNNNWETINKAIDDLQKKDNEFFGAEGKYAPDEAKGPDLIYRAKQTLRNFYPF